MQNNKFRNPFENWNEQVSQMWNTSKMQEQASKNMEALAAANQIVVDGVQVLTRRATEEMQKNAQRGMECFKEACTTGSLEEAQKIQSTYASEWMQSFVGNARETTEVASRAAMELADVANRTVAENASNANRAAEKMKAANTANKK